MKRMEVENRARNANNGGGKQDEPPLPTEAELSGQKTKNIKMKQYLCVKHALPKTRLTHAILHENVSQDRHLELQLSEIRHSKTKASNMADLTSRAFVAQQERKMKKWKKEDENRIAGMNLPSINHTDVETPPVTVVIYHMPENGSGRDSRHQQSLPMMRVRRERTEIVSHQDKTFVTKFPPVVEYDFQKLERHNTYCGKSLLAEGMPCRDNRFQFLKSSLNPAMLKSSNSYPLENMISKSRRAKYAKIFPLSMDPGMGRSSDLKVIVASRPKSNSSKISEKSFGSGTRTFSYSKEKREVLDQGVTNDFDSKNPTTLTEDLKNDVPKS